MRGSDRASNSVSKTAFIEGETVQDDDKEENGVDQHSEGRNLLLILQSSAGLKMRELRKPWVSGVLSD